MPVTYEEMEGSPQEEFGEQGFTATRTLRCDWDERLLLAIELRGGVISGAYVAPATYPHFSAARCQSIGIVGHDEDRPMPLAGDTSKASYEKALLTVRYGIPNTGGSGTGTSDDPVIVYEENLEGWAEYLTQEPVGLAWGSDSGDPLTADETPGKLLKGLTWVYTRHFLTSVPAEVLTLPGKVNDSTMSSPSLGLTFPAETLLFNPPLLARQVTSDGTATVSLTYRFNSKEHTWNRFWRAASQSWEQIFVIETNTVFKPYEPADFTPLTT
jgi:hypothetical protein